MNKEVTDKQKVSDRQEVKDKQKSQRQAEKEVHSPRRDEAISSHT